MDPARADSWGRPGCSLSFAMVSRIANPAARRTPGDPDKQRYARGRPWRVLSDFVELTNDLLYKKDVSRLDNMIVESGGFDPGLIFGSPKACQRDCYWTLLRMDREQLLQEIVSGDDQILEDADLCVVRMP
jgi:hypothetical protein